MSVYLGDKLISGVPDKSVLSGLGMPSSRYDVLTLGATGSTYEAPANGYFALFAAYSSGADAVLALQNRSSPASILGMEHFWYSAKGNARLSCPVKKGDVAVVSYNCTLKNVFFYFIYAEGSK